jgi:protein-S-isoprenylcysteine O-methyltransferase Ste14
MPTIRPIAAFISIFLFAVTAIVTHFAMDRSDYSFCDKRLVITIVTLVALGLLIVSLRVGCPEGASIQKRCLKGASYVLVVAVSAGFWFDVWATQQCNESMRNRVEKLQH